MPENLELHQRANVIKMKATNVPIAKLETKLAAITTVNEGMTVEQHANKVRDALILAGDVKKALDYLIKHENHRHENWGNSGMVYWAENTLKKLADYPLNTDMTNKEQAWTSIHSGLPTR